MPHPCRRRARAARPYGTGALFEDREDRLVRIDLARREAHGHEAIDVALELVDLAAAAALDDADGAPDADVLVFVGGDDLRAAQAGDGLAELLAEVAVGGLAGHDPDGADVAPPQQREGMDAVVVDAGGPVLLVLAADVERAAVVRAVAVDDHVLERRALVFE